MKKIFTLAAAILASISLWAETANLTATTGVNFAAKDYTWPDVAKNKVLYDAATNPQIMAWSNGNAISFDTSNGMKIGNSSKESAVVFRVASKSNITVNVGRNGSDVTVQLLYLGESTDVLTSSNLAPGTATKCDEVAISSSSATGALEYTGNAGYYKIYGNPRFCVKDISVAEACTDPEAVLKLSKTSMFVNEQAHLDFTTKGTSEDWGIYVKKDGKEATYGVDYSLSSYPAMYPVSIDVTPLKAGTFELTAFQESDGTYCALEKSVTVTVSEADPVTAVTVDGPAAGFIGQELTYTATAVGATAYQWLVDGVDANTNAATFTYTAVKGDHSIVCKARNQFNVQNEEETWVESAPIALKVTSLYGEIIKATLTSGTAATVTGIVGGTADVSLSSSKKMDKGKYFGFTLAKGAFAEGDTVVIVMTTAGSNYPCLFGDKAKTKLLYLATEASSALEYKIVLPAEAEGLTSLYLVRDGDDATYKWNPVLSSISVIRPKAVDHADVTLVGATIDGEALPSDFVTHLINEGTFTILTSYVNAPVVAFVKHTDTYYEGETEPVSTNDSIKVTATEVEGKWQAQATIGANTYTITLAKAASFSVVYMLGEKKLGEELVAANGNPAEYETYQAIKLATFKGWYSDKALETPVADMSAEVISADKIYYAKFEYKYSQSINISKWILENGAGKGATDKSTALINLLGSNYYTSNFAWENGNLELDSLDDSKTDRNEPYLGLKVKKSGAMFRLRLAPGSYVNIKIGAYKGILQVAINDGEFAEAVLTDGVYHYEATGEDLVSFKMKDGNAVVLQQLMINEAIQEVLLPWTITCSDTENGSLAADKKVAYKGEEVKLTVTPNAGYQIASVTVNGEPLVADGEGNYVFEMLNEKVTVAAIFSVSTALDNTEAEGKAVKVVRDGQLLILKNGVLYNAQGAIVK